MPAPVPQNSMLFPVDVAVASNIEFQGSGVHQCSCKVSGSETAGAFCSGLPVSGSCIRRRFVHRPSFRVYRSRVRAFGGVLSTAHHLWLLTCSGLSSACVCVMYVCICAFAFDSRLHINVGSICGCSTPMCVCLCWLHHWLVHSQLAVRVQLERKCDVCMCVCV